MAGVILKTCLKLSHITVVFGLRGLSLSPSTSLWHLLAGKPCTWLLNEMRGRRTASLPELKGCLAKHFSDKTVPLGSPGSAPAALSGWCCPVSLAWASSVLRAAGLVSVDCLR